MFDSDLVAATTRPTTKASAGSDDTPVSVTITQVGNRATVAFDISLNTGQILVVSLA